MRNVTVAHVGLIRTELEQQKKKETASKVEASSALAEKTMAEAIPVTGATPLTIDVLAVELQELRREVTGDHDKVIEATIASVRGPWLRRMRW
ncbi:hypothetical protein scyTo_0022924 [Scyliorhinus torazame]|uniref:Uncharacterized protein n=1 Tax=Scyliorhinus torazame TaxID=75743 RepID=A0A401Q5V7_SCYTO|nr:hypothetical protein [Scyliorhinus torazame]